MKVKLNGQGGTSLQKTLKTRDQGDHVHARKCSREVKLSMGGVGLKRYKKEEDWREGTVGLHTGNGWMRPGGSEG